MVLQHRVLILKTECLYLPALFPVSVLSALSNIENGNPYSILFAVGKNVPDIAFSLGRGQATSDTFQESKFKTTKPIGLAPGEDVENVNWLSILLAYFGCRFQAVGLKTVGLQLFFFCFHALLPFITTCRCVLHPPAV